MAEVIRSHALHGAAHGFLDAAQSDAARFDLVPHAIGPVFVRQTHSAIVLAVERPFAGELPEADGLVSATPGLALAIRTADCAPVLLADCAACVVGAAHAGWRGAIGGVLEATVDAMEQLGAVRSRIVAAIGPTIAQPSYEVDTPFRNRFCDDSSANADLFVPAREGHFLFDLPRYVVRRLQHRAGIGFVHDLEYDTYADDHRFHSFRRATHRGESTMGRQFSLIALEDSAQQAASVT